MAWYRAVLECDSVPSNAGEQGAIDITENFAKRTWHRNARCAWDGKSLTLTAENDFDPEGRALLDEFSDEISACISGSFDGNLRLVSITEISEEA